MKRKDFIKLSSIGISSLFLLPFSGCESDLGFKPKDRISSANFPTDKADIKSLLNGVYSQLRSNSIYNQGLFGGFGVLDGATPNAFNWGNTSIDKYGTGDLTSEDGQIVDQRWTRCYSIINKVNYLLQQIPKIELSKDINSMYVGEAHFLRGFAYAALANSYGRVPIITSVISSKQARNLSQASVEKIWDQAISDYNIAISNLSVDASAPGRATKGAAFGMKMRAYLYQNKFEKVLDMVNKIEELGKYSLFPSYQGLFKLENENNSEVMFDVQYIQGKNGQGSLHDQYCGTGTGSFTRGTRYVPTQNLVDAYEMAPEGHKINPKNNPIVPSEGPYQGRDPRLYFTVVLPHTTAIGYMFPKYIYPGGAYNHPANRLKRFSSRKYFIQDMSKLPPAGESNLNDILLRYADVILSKAEALIETGGSVNEAITLINKIRRDRDDVTLRELSMGMSRDMARKALRHERRIEFALENLYWSDIKRWNELDGYAKRLYPVEIKDRHGNLLETKFANGYKDYYKYLPIPDREISLNNNLKQNPGY